MDRETTVVVSEENFNWKLKRFHLEIGLELDTAPLEKEPSGMAVVNLDGRTCVVLSYK